MRLLLCLSAALTLTHALLCVYAGSDKITDAHERELGRILQISFNPLSATMITDMDKVRVCDVRAAPV